MPIALTAAEVRALEGTSVPEQLFLAPPAPAFSVDCHTWKANALRLDAPPDLADCAPLGLDVADNDPRLLYHARMRTVTTAAINQAWAVVSRQIRANCKRSYGKTGVFVDGARGTGKTALLQALGVNLERRLAQLYEPDENRVPVVWLTVPPPTRSGARDWPAAFARYFGQERDSANLTASVIHAMRNARTQLVLIDGIERLRTRADVDATFDQLDYLIEDTGATFVYCGRGSLSLLDRVTRDNDTPLATQWDEERRGDHPVIRLNRIGYSDGELRKFARIVNLFDADLRLFRHERGDLRKLATYLHNRSHGNMRALSQLICQGAQLAILSKQERITEKLLDQVQTGKVLDV